MVQLFKAPRVSVAKLMKDPLGDARVQPDALG